jgi:hypothetical protein
MTTTVMVYKNPNLGGLVDIELLKNNEIIKRMRLTRDEWGQLKKIVGMELVKPDEEKFGEPRQFTIKIIQIGFPGSIKFGVKLTQPDTDFSVENPSEEQARALLEKARKAAFRAMIDPRKEP